MNLSKRHLYCPYRSSVIGFRSWWEGPVSQTVPKITNERSGRSQIFITCQGWVAQQIPKSISTLIHRGRRKCAKRNRSMQKHDFLGGGGCEGVVSTVVYLPYIMVVYMCMIPRTRKASTCDARRRNHTLQFCKIAN